MKKTVFVSMLSLGLIASSCGGDSEEGSKDKASACKTGNGVAIDCGDADNFKKIGELTKKFELTFPENVEEYKAFIATNEAVLTEIDPLWQSMENIVKEDPGIAEQQHYTKTMDYRAKVEMYKAVLADLEKVSISGAYQDTAVILTIANGASHPLKELRGHLQYLDKEGNVVCEKDYELSAKSLSLDGGIPVGYNGTTDKGIYCKDGEKVSAVKFETTGLDYFEEELD